MRQVYITFYCKKAEWKILEIFVELFCISGAVTLVSHGSTKSTRFSFPYILVVEYTNIY